MLTHTDDSLNDDPIATLADLLAVRHPEYQPNVLDGRGLTVMRSLEEAILEIEMMEDEDEDEAPDDLDDDDESFEPLDDPLDDEDDLNEGVDVMDDELPDTLVLPG